ncbi:hypothetical protein KFE25_003735 [Diacronema lutheri]|uniref:Exostosin GT47 domain-containing protein n=1 Tax=Diacronema lutheri TaxID=2081491 RepID=A0A8J6C3N2_DIALT|nr:hypothetical protein KFE25_003735 [Diacronema lutheri]
MPPRAGFGLPPIHCTFLLLGVTFAPTACTTATPDRPRVVVSELFRELMRSNNSRSACVTKRRSKLPLPTLAELNRSLLSESVLYNARARTCPSKCADGPHGASRPVAPRGMCVHSTPFDKKYIVDQYSLHLVVLSRFLQIVPICTDERGSCGADIVVVPSFTFHVQLIVNEKGIRSGCFHAKQMWAFWESALRRHGRMDDPRGGPLIFVPEPRTWDAVHANVELLAALPPAFVSRVAIGTIMSNIDSASAARMEPGWRDGAEEELRRREGLLARWQRSAHEPMPLSFGGPLLITLPIPMGYSQAFDLLAFDAQQLRQHGRAGVAAPEASANRIVRRDIAILWSAGISRTSVLFARGRHQAIRPRMANALLAAGARCTNRDMSHCVICAPGVSDQAGWCAAGEGPESGVFEPLRATFCIEPPGDTLGRSHPFLAIQSGCIPVLIDGGHRAYAPGPTWWPWRPARPSSTPDDGAADGDLAQRLSAGASAVRNSSSPADPANGGGRETRGSTLTVPYEEFAVLIDEAEVIQPGDAWLQRLIALAADDAWVARKRAAMQRVAPHFVFAPRGCGRAECGDAFSGLQRALKRAWVASAALDELRAVRHAPRPNLTSDARRRPEGPAALPAAERPSPSRGAPPFCAPRLALGELVSAPSFSCAWQNACAAPLVARPLSVARVPRAFGAQRVPHDASSRAPLSSLADAERLAAFAALEPPDVAELPTPLARIARFAALVLAPYMGRARAANASDSRSARALAGVDVHVDGARSASVILLDSSFGVIARAPLASAGALAPCVPERARLVDCRLFRHSSSGSSAAPAADAPRPADARDVALALWLHCSCAMAGLAQQEERELSVMAPLRLSTMDAASCGQQQGCEVLVATLGPAWSMPHITAHRGKVEQQRRTRARWQSAGKGDQAPSGLGMLRSPPRRPLFFSSHGELYAHGAELSRRALVVHLPTQPPSSVGAAVRCCAPPVQLARARPTARATADGATARGETASSTTKDGERLAWGLGEVVDRTLLYNQRAALTIAAGLVHLADSAELLGVARAERPCPTSAEGSRRCTDRPARFFTHVFFTLDDAPPFAPKRLGVEFCLPSTTTTMYTNGNTNDNEPLDCDANQVITSLALVHDEQLPNGDDKRDSDGARSLAPRDARILVFYSTFLLESSVLGGDHRRAGPYGGADIVTGQRARPGLQAEGQAPAPPALQHIVTVATFGLQGVLDQLAIAS